MKSYHNMSITKSRAYKLKLKPIQSCMTEFSQRLSHLSERVSKVSEDVQALESGNSMLGRPLQVIELKQLLSIDLKFQLLSR